MRGCVRIASLVGEGECVALPYQTFLHMSLDSHKALILQRISARYSRLSEGGVKRLKGVPTGPMNVCAVFAVQRNCITVSVLCLLPLCMLYV